MHFAAWRQIHRRALVIGKEALRHYVRSAPSYTGEKPFALLCHSRETDEIVWLPLTRLVALDRALPVSGVIQGAHINIARP